jgi:hypothetical protein
MNTYMNIPILAIVFDLNCQLDGFARRAVAVFLSNLLLHERPMNFGFEKVVEVLLQNHRVSAGLRNSLNRFDFALHDWVSFPKAYSSNGTCRMIYSP